MDMKIFFVISLCLIYQCFCCSYTQRFVLPYDDPKFTKVEALPNVYNWDQMLLFIPDSGSKVKHPYFKPANLKKNNFTALESKVFKFRKKNNGFSFSHRK